MNRATPVRPRIQLQLAMAAGASIALASLALPWYTVEETILGTQSIGVRPFDSTGEPAAYAFVAGTLLTLLGAISAAWARSGRDRLLTSSGSVAAALVGLVGALVWRPLPDGAAASILRSLVGGAVTMQPAIGLFLALAGLAVAATAGVALVLRR